MPYCPACSLERTSQSPTCPLDGHYYRIERCSSCRGERAPTERWCIHCGAEIRRPLSEVVSLQVAGRGRRALGLAVDLLCLLYLAAAVPLSLGVVLAVWASLPLLFVPYFTVWTSGGRRTIGEQVLGLAVLGLEREPLPWRGAALRGVVLAVSLALGGLPLFLSRRSDGRLLHDIASGAEVYVA